MDLPQVLPINPGGGLAPHQILGRDRLVADLWLTLREQSVLIAAERRMGKTSVLRKLSATAADHGAVAVLRDVEDCSTSQDFVTAVLAALVEALPLRHRAARAVRDLIGDLGLTLEIQGVSVKVQGKPIVPWQEQLEQIVAAVTRVNDSLVVLLLDEIPYMLSKVQRSSGGADAREMLDVMRALRSRHGGVRFVFSGSVGLHHVLNELQEPKLAWAPVNDMYLVDLPPLSAPAAGELARRLLDGTTVPYDDETIATIVHVTDGVGYYIHHTVKQLASDGAVSAPSARTATTSEVVDDTVGRAIDSPVDILNLRYLVERISSYYGDRRLLAITVLDSLALSPQPLKFQDIKQRAQGQLVTGSSTEDLHQVIDLLLLDHYLVRTDGGRLAFRLGIGKRAWSAMRYLGGDNT